MSRKEKTTHNTQSIFKACFDVKRNNNQLEFLSE